MFSWLKLSELITKKNINYYDFNYSGAPIELTGQFLNLDIFTVEAHAMIGSLRRELKYLH